MNPVERQVREYHTKHGFPVDGRVNCRPIPYLEFFGNELKKLAADMLLEALLDAEQGDDRKYRAHLMLEELGESFCGMGQGNEQATADGLADLMYVVIGTFVSFGIPVATVMDEVHRSNMTKMIRDPNTNPRMRDKGPDYSPPNFIRAIESGRAFRSM